MRSLRYLLGGWWEGVADWQDGRKDLFGIRHGADNYSYESLIQRGRPGSADNGLLLLGNKGLIIQFYELPVDNCGSPFEHPWS